MLTLPHPSPVCLDKSKNTYTYNEKQFPRVSSVLKHIYPSTFTPIPSEGDVNPAIQAGTDMHARIANTLTAPPDSDVAHLLDQEDAHFRAYQAARLTGWTLVAAEYPIASESLNYAGSFDALFFDPTSKEYILIDWKRSTELTRSTERYYTLQLNLYAHALEEQHNISVSRMFIILLHPRLEHPIECPIEIGIAPPIMRSITELARKQAPPVLQ